MKRGALILRVGNSLLWIPLIAYSALIFRVSGDPRPLDLTEKFEGFDKVLHCGAYGLWAILCALPLARLRVWSRLSALWRIAIPATGGAVYGLSDELHQSLVPGREASAGDWVADSLGALAGAVVFELLVRALRRLRDPGNPSESPEYPE